MRPRTEPRAPHGTPTGPHGTSIGTPLTLHGAPPARRYKALHPLLREWAIEHKLEFRTSGEWEILVQNVNQLKKMGNLPAVEGNPDSTPVFKQV